MVEANSLFTSFVQSCNSCTLASYAVASYHFTQIPPTRFFEDYCKHFGVSGYTSKNAESAYDDHFQQEWQRRVCRGYQIIEEVHRNSSQPAFAKSRETFDVRFIDDVNTSLIEIEGTLKLHEALVSVAFRIPVSHVHSCTVGYDNGGWYMIETRPSSRLTGVVPIQSIQSLGHLLDGLLLTKR